MINNYIKIASRNIVRHKLFSFINAFGLSLAIAFCVLIYLFIQDERSFDTFHVNKDNIYRLEGKRFVDGLIDSNSPYQYTESLQTALAQTIKEEVPQVHYATRFSNGDVVMTYDNKTFREGIGYIDQDFFDMFSFSILAGDKNKLFADKYNVVLTSSLAEKYFGTQDILGKVVQLNVDSVKNFTVSGVIQDVPGNSSLSFEMLISYEHRKLFFDDSENWQALSAPTFVQLHPQSDLSLFDKYLSDIVDKYMSEELEKNKEQKQIPENISLFEYQYSSLESLHFHPEISCYKSGDPKYSIILGSLAILILLIAIINYISLSLTTSRSRKMEVGLRKSLGATRNQVINQFSLESVILSILSMIIGMILVYFFLPIFNQFTDKNILLSNELGIEIVGFGFLLSIFTGLAASFYPAFYLSSFRPSEVLRDGFTSKLKIGFIKPLVIIQFIASTFLIISASIMYQQMDYIATKQLGFDTERVLVLHIQRGFTEKSNRMVNKLKALLSSESYVKEVCGTNMSFGRGSTILAFDVDGEQKKANLQTIDPSYLNLLGVKLIQGRNFNEGIASDTLSIIINETMVKQMGWKYPIGQYINYKRDKSGPGAKVIGVVKDHHFESLSHKIKPLILSMDAKSYGALTKLLIKVNTDEMANAIGKLEIIWKNLNPEIPFTYTFLESDILQQYQTHEYWMGVMGFSALFAIFISCLGLFGLAGANSVNRIKEVGIRKVFGAKTSSIIVLLNTQYLFLAIIAFILAMPLSWFVMQEWLSGFEYKTTMGWGTFAFSLISLLLVAFFTVSYHAFRATQSKPADTLKYE